MNFILQEVALNQDLGIETLQVVFALSRTMASEAIFEAHFHLSIEAVKLITN